jgi:hypothetical protein
MFNEFKNGEKVIVYGPGENDGKFYRNIPAKIIERDPYYKDYHVEFKDGTDDWILSEHIRKPYSRKKKRSK